MLMPDKILNCSMSRPALNHHTMNTHSNTFGAMLSLAACVLLACAASANAKPAASLSWDVLPPIPDEHGFASPFAGVNYGALIVAGGTNFPEKKIWEGGTKVW